MVHSAEDGSIPVLDMSALIALLDASETGSYVLDEIIISALCRSKFRTCIAGLPDEKGGLWMYEFDGHAPSSALRVTQSLDAALALAERVLPGWRKFVEVVGDGRGSACVFLAHEAIDRPWFHAPTPALALCISILRAIQHGYEAAGVVSPNLNPKAQGEGG